MDPIRAIVILGATALATAVLVYALDRHCRVACKLRTGTDGGLELDCRIEPDPTDAR